MVTLNLLIKGGNNRSWDCQCCETMKGLNMRSWKVGKRSLCLNNYSCYEFKCKGVCVEVRNTVSLLLFQKKNISILIGNHYL